MDYIKIQFLSPYFEVCDDTMKDGTTYSCSKSEQQAYSDARDYQKQIQDETGIRLPIRQYVASGAYLEL